MDARFQPYLNASDEDAERLLGELIQTHAVPVVRTVVQSKLEDSADAEDVESDVMVELLQRIRALRNRTNPDPVEDLTAYAATVAYNMFHRHLRKKHPLRAQLQTRLRHLLTTRPGLALWTVPPAVTACGLAEWRGRRPVVPNPVPPLTTGPETSPLDFVLEYFRVVAAPAEFRVLVDAAGRAFGIDDMPVPTDVAEAQIRGGHSPNPHRIAEARLFARQLWQEIRELPLKQRAALLLNVKDNGIQLFPLCGVASIRELAAALEMPAEELASLWRSLPLDDNAIALILDATRQQVINLRLSARKRLSNRSRDWG
ncbi:MAG: sigma-70 family RNA polymerase sigma factor [Acidobacteria bacterium]|nr:sigma-70 family RNA polymerase sigma factor [Acidobacteriota bacterium]